MRTKPRLEKHIEAEIIYNLRTLGFMVTKTSQPRPSMLTRGIPDLYAAHPKWGVRFWIEVKRPGKAPSVWQRVWHQIERDAGGSVIVATSTGDVLDHLRGLGVPIS